MNLISLLWIPVKHGNMSSQKNKHGNAGRVSVSIKHWKCFVNKAI